MPPVFDPAMSADPIHKATPLEAAVEAHPAPVAIPPEPQVPPIDGEKSNGDAVVDVNGRNGRGEEDLGSQPEEKAKLSNFWVGSRN